MEIEIQALKEEMKKMAIENTEKILDEIGELKNNVKKIAEKVEANSKAISAFGKELNEIREENKQNLKGSNGMTNVEELLAEAQRQAKNLDKLFVSNSGDEESIEIMINDIAKKDVKINFTDVGGKRNNADEGRAFIIQFESKVDREQVMKNKAKYLKEANSRVGINFPMTKHQRNNNEEGRTAKRNNKQAEEPEKNDDNIRTRRQSSNARAIGRGGTGRGGTRKYDKEATKYPPKNVGRTNMRSSISTLAADSYNFDEYEIPGSSRDPEKLI